MTTVNIQEAKTRLSELLVRVANGEDIIIARAGSPVARLVAMGEPAPRHFGGTTLTVPEDFDAPLDEAELALWE